MRQFCISLIIVLAISLPAFGQSTANPQPVDWDAVISGGLDAVILKAKTEEARLKAERVAAERKASVFLDEPESLLPLDTTETVWVTKDRKTVVIIGKVVLRKGLLEFFACVAGTKEHESILALPVKPHVIHAGLLAIGAEPGAPAQFDPKFVPAKGEKIEVKVRWKDAEGKIREVDAQDWVLEAASKKKMSIPWVFTGSVLRKMDDGVTVYLADATGEIIGLSNFPASVLDVPIESTDSNEELLFTPNTAEIPEVGTRVTVLLRPIMVEKAEK